MHSHLDGPSYSGTVVLDIGGDTGGLIVYTGPDEHGLEIEISPAGEDRRTHAAVRARHVHGRTLYGAVYAALPAGPYTIWRDADTPADTVSVHAGAITEFEWPSP